ncbi:MAG: hypothetical protein AAF498_05645 [Pseudomonadota bacterium]
MMADGGNVSAGSKGAAVILRVPTRNRRGRRSNNKPRRLHAKAIKRILDRETGDLVGWLYEWNTGELVPRWKTEAWANVVYV